MVLLHSDGPIPYFASLIMHTTLLHRCLWAAKSSVITHRGVNTGTSKTLPITTVAPSSRCPHASLYCEARTEVTPVARTPVTPVAPRRDPSSGLRMSAVCPSMLAHEFLNEDCEVNHCSLTLRGRPFSSIYECHGCYKVFGPALIVKKKIHGRMIMEAFLMDGARLEFPDPEGQSFVLTKDGTGMTTQDDCDPESDIPSCMLIGQHVELSGSYDIGNDTHADTHLLPGKGSLVVSLRSLEENATIFLEEGGALSYPVNIQPPP